MNFRNLFNTCGLAFAVLMSVFMTSCNGMWDEEGQDCTTYKRIRFTYDWNMLFADAFPHEVKTLTLYAFAPDGTLVYERKANADSILAKGYMDVNDLPSGNYTFQVWAEGEQRYDNSYIFGSPLSGNNARTGLTAALTEAAGSTNTPAGLNNTPAGTANESAGRVSNDIVVANHIPVTHDLTPLYYGASGVYGTEKSSDFTDIPLGGTREATINLMKDTENFRIVLQDQNGEAVDPNNFRFTITDDNGSMDADNNVLNTGDSLVYNAWSVINGEAGIPKTDETNQSSQTITSLSAVVAELTTNRLINGHNMRLHVTNVKDGKEIINLPLIDLCLLVKGNYNRSMSNQEYLDRQDTWNFIFFLSQGKWLAASIYIQSWRVVLQDVNL